MIEQNEPAVTDAKGDAVAFVGDRKATWETSMQTKRDQLSRLDKRYKNYREDLSASSGAQAAPRANIGVPLAAETVDTAVARSHDVLLGQRPYGRIRPTEGMDDYKAAIHQTIIDIQQSKSWFPRNIHRIMRDAFKYGLGLGKMHFKRVTKVVPEPVTIMGIRVGTRRVVKDIIQTPYVEHVNIQDVFFPMDAPSIQEAEGIIHRTWNTSSDLLNAKDGIGAPLYDPAAVQEAIRFKTSRDSDANLQNETTIRGIQEGGLHKDSRIALLEYTGRLPLNLAEKIWEELYPDYPKDIIHEDWIIAIVDGVDTPLRCEPSPYDTDQRMWVEAKIIDDPGFVFGQSLIEAVESLGLTVDELYNIVLDNLNFVINKQYYINELAGIDEADVVSSPGKVIRGKRPFQEAMGVIQTPDISQSVFILIQNFLAHYKEYTGIQNPQLGGSAQGRQTAYEVSAMEAHSATRLGQFDRMLEDTLMRSVFERFVILNQQFLDQEFVARMLQTTQPMLPRVAPEDLAGTFDYSFDGASKAQADAMAIGQYLQAIQINSTLQVPIWDNLYLGRKLAERWRWVNPEEGLNPQYMPQYQMYQQMAAMQAMGETAKAITPEQRAQSSKTGRNASKQGAAAQAENVGVKNFQSALAAVKEKALPQGITEGGL